MGFNLGFKGLSEVMDKVQRKKSVSHTPLS